MFLPQNERPSFAPIQHICFETFRNNDKFLRWGVFSPAPNPQTVGPPSVSCPRLLIQYIRSYHPYPEDFPPSVTWGSAMTWWQGTHLTR
jgi:hypothetical protein